VAVAGTPHTGSIERDDRRRVAPGDSCKTNLVGAIRRKQNPRRLSTSPNETARHEGDESGVPNSIRKR
jgi:hypothetical protein